MIVMLGNGEAARKLVLVCGVIAKIAEGQYPIARGIRIENQRALDTCNQVNGTLGTYNHQGEVWMQ
jgi:hypothetical protein